MIYTTQTPTQPVWYWWRNEYKRAARLLEITDAHIKGHGFFVVGAYTKSMVAIGGEWAGPIPEPTERDDRETQP